MNRAPSGGFLMDFGGTMDLSADLSNSTLVPPVEAAGEVATLSPYLQDLSWIHPPEDRNVSKYLNLDFSRCPPYFAHCRVRVVLDVYVLVPLIVAGLIGNSLAYMVLKWDSLNVAVSMQLQALAIMDNIYLLCCFFYQTLKAVSDCTTWSAALVEGYGLIMPVVWPLASIAQTCTVWIVALITIDRYFAICRPFQSKILGTPSRVRKAVLLIVVAAVVYNLPRFFESSPDYLPHFCPQAMRYTAIATPMRKSRMYYIIYKVCCYFTFRVFLPFTILITLNTSLIRSLRHIYRDHATLTRQQTQRNDHFTLLLVAMVTVFIICEMPDLIMRLISTISKFCKVKVDVSFTTTFTNFLLAFNSSVNCVIYCLVARRFRKILHRHFFRLCSSKYTPKKSFSSVNSMQIRQDTSHELIRFTTCAEQNAGDCSPYVRTCGATDSSTGKSSSEVLLHSNGLSAKDASQV